MNRIYVFLLLPLTIFIGSMLTAAERRYSRRTRITLFWLTAALLLLDNFNLQNPTLWRYSDYRRQLDAVSAPPPDCRVFFLAPESPGNGRNWSDWGLDAWLIANRFQRFTINGYSGNYPPTWAPIEHLDAPEYLPGVQAWVRQYALKELYMYDRRNNRWTRHNIP